MSNEQTVTVHDMTIESFQTSEGEVVVDKVKFETLEAPNGATVEQLTFKPRTTETVTHEMGGIETSETNTVRYTPATLVEDYEWIKPLQQALNDGKQVELTADVSIFDQRADPETDGDEAYAYIDSDDEDSLMVLFDDQNDKTSESDADSGE